MLNLAVLRAVNLDRAEAFYGRLGLVFVRHRHGSGPEHLSAEAGGGVFEVYPLTPDTAPTTGARVGFAVPDVDAAVAALRDAGAEVVSPPKPSPWGRRAVVTDPDGHRVELTQLHTQTNA